jgi:hypothetical protein
MTRPALARRAAMLTAPMLLVAFPAVAQAAYSPFHPFYPRGNSEAVKEKIAEEFPGARIPTQEGIVCSSAEHSYNGPASYCFVEFTTGPSWNLAEVSMTTDLVGGTGVTANVYRHTTWKRRWQRCPLRRRVPGTLYANDECGRMAPERDLTVTDVDMIEFNALPGIRAQRPIRAISRDFTFAGAVPSISRYRATQRGNLYTFTNAVGDSLRYRAAAK